MRAFIRFKTTRTERHLLHMQAAENVIVLNEGEDVTKLDGLQDSTLKELLKYQGDSSAFDIDDEKAILENLPTRLSVQQIKLL